MVYLTPNSNLQLYGNFASGCTHLSYPGDTKLINKFKFYKCIFLYAYTIQNFYFELKLGYKLY